MVGRFIIIFLLITAIELYFLQAVKTFSQDFSSGKKNAMLYTAYTLAALNFLLGIVAAFYPPPNWNGTLRFISMGLIILALCKLLGISFLIIDDVIRLFRWIFSFLKSAPAETVEVSHKISRLKFMSQLAITFTVVPAIGF